MIKDWIQRLLGIDLVLTNLHDIRENRLNDRRLLNRLETECNAARSHAIVANRGMARLIAKLDPAYNKDMLSREARAESDEIADRVMNQLFGEHKASNPHD